METIKIKAYAKINLSLDILGRRSNGYHDVEMIMQQVTLYDEIIISKKETGITIATDCYYIPSNSKNIAYKIAEDVLNRYNIDSGILIEIKKNIPVAAGLAGGSADAAAVIKGLNILFDLNITLEEMKIISLKHGADIPFCLEGGAAVARGIGEELQPLPSLKDVWIVLYKPSIGVSTQEIYKALDLGKVKAHPDTPMLIQAMENNDFRTISYHMYNVLEEVTSSLYSEIDVSRKKMKAYGALGTMMSGSGPTVFGIFKNYKTARSAYQNLVKINKQVYLVQTYNGGNGDE